MYRVKFYNPDKPGSGYIDSYEFARDAKSVVGRVNALHIQDGHGVLAEYLGKRRPPSSEWPRLKSPITPLEERLKLRHQVSALLRGETK